MAAVVNKIRTNVYLDLNIKNKAQEILNQYGIGLSDAFNIFLAQTVLEEGIPFQIKIPNKETKQAILDARAGINMSKISLNDLKKEINA
ncbi:MAG: type II toxin-antitoxin system RelB/DinJ family antitoxin [Campylobacterales bacterium]|nr:type II toxin-antitoxin system RelB/DinJ family antitoxin [Campylobacterales bacterium]